MAPEPGGIAVGVLGRKVAAALERQPPEAVWAAELRELAGALDLVVCNVECCISQRGRPTTLIEGEPFFFRGPPAAVTGADLVAGRSAHVFHGIGWDGGPTLFDVRDVLGEYMIDPELRNDPGVLAIWRPSADPQLELVGLLHAVGRRW